MKMRLRRWLLFTLHWKLGPPVLCSVCRTLWRDCQSQFRRCTWKTTILHLEVRKTTVFCPLFFINLGQTCAESVFVWFLLISPSRKSTLIVHFFPYLLWKKLRNKLIQLNLVDLVLREVDLEGVPQCHHLQLCELVLLGKKIIGFLAPQVL